MDKGIRPYCNAKFVELNEQRRRGLLTNTAFRKNVIADVMEQFGTTLASAATHYNHAFKTVKALNSELVSGLGRADDKKGGRKPKAKQVADAVKAILGDAAPTNFWPVGGFLQLPAPAVSTLISQGVKENTSTQTVTVNPPAVCELTPDAETQTVFVVRKKADDSVVAKGLSFEDARALVAKAAAAKKAKLYLV